MPYLDEIAQKRQEQSDAKRAEGLHAQNIEAIFSSGKVVADATNKLAKPEDIDSIIKQLKDLQLTQLLEAQARNSKKVEPNTVIIKDQIDISDAIEKVGETVAAAVKGLDSSEQGSQHLTSLGELKTALDSYTQSINSGNAKSEKVAQDLLKAVRAITVSPVVNVPEPKVTIKESKIDFAPLQDTIREYMTPPDEKIDLGCYRAQDISESDGKQYVGFVNPDGQWYIIENDTQKNKLRYVFGNDGYSKAFRKAATYEYSLLNEAINAL